MFRRHGSNPGTILDLGCGTGAFCAEMYRKGYHVMGVDSSPDMLSCANKRASEKGMEIMFVNQDMTELELDVKVDAAVCLTDSVNHIIHPHKAGKFFSHVFDCLNPGGLFIFDINTRYKLERIMGDNVFYSIDEDVACLWQCNFNRPISKMDITLFVRKGNLYERFDEVIYERAYEDAEIRDFIEKSGFKLLNVYDGESFSKPYEKSERVFYVCQR